MAFALAGGRTEGLSVLAEPRSVAAVPFAGKFRLIDFTLSNCVNSEIKTVALLAQYAPLSLAAYVGRGKPWDLDRRDGGVTILQPYARQEGTRWYEGTADAIRQNLDVLDNSGAERVFILSTDIVYKMDYSWLLHHHLETGAQVTLAVGGVPHAEVSRFGMVTMGDGGRILDFEEKPTVSRARHAFMGIYLAEASFLKQILEENSGANLNLDVLRPMMTDPDLVRAYEHGGYWDDVGTLPEYHRAHMELLGTDPALDLYDYDWRIYARSEEMSPALFHSSAEVVESLVANGAVIEGRIERSVISPGVHVGPGAVVSESILLNGTVVGTGCVVERAIVDKNVILGAGSRIGRSVQDGAGTEGDLAGIAVIGKWNHLPPESTVLPGQVVPVVEPRVEPAGMGLGETMTP
jgi:glucose-1-phosphate adenylyltransferase